MAEKRDYYEVLGVEKGATADELKKAYRTKAMEYHPDQNAGDAQSEEKFKEVNEAYDVLKDDQKRAAYDSFGHGGADPNMGGGFGGGFGGFGGGGGSPFGGFDFSDIFSTIFDFGGETQTGPQRGEDLRVEIRVSFIDAVFGAEKEFSINRKEECPTCHGNGSKDGSAPAVCPRCNGSGREQVNIGIGRMNIRTCSMCKGEGYIISDPCLECKGKGAVNRKRSITLKVHAGVGDGDRTRLRGQGNAGKKGGPSGDLIVYYSVGTHKLFSRDGNDLKLEMTIPYALAALGGELVIPSLDGDIQYVLKEGTQPGETIVIRDKGVPYLGGKGRGNLRVKVSIRVPKRISGKQKEILRNFEESFGRKAYDTDFEKPKERDK